jgi:hypothetical protein
MGTLLIEDLLEPMQVNGKIEATMHFSVTVFLLLSEAVAYAAMMQHASVHELFILGLQLIQGVQLKKPVPEAVG